MKEIIRKGSGDRFFDQAKQDWAPSTDFDLCLERDTFDFILKVENDGLNNYLRKIQVSEKVNVITE
jgi:2-phosphosulfolactate phosphatase